MQLQLRRGELGSCLLCIPFQACPAPNALPVTAQASHGFAHLPLTIPPLSAATLHAPFPSQRCLLTDLSFLTHLTSDQPLPHYRPSPPGPAAHLQRQGLLAGRAALPRAAGPRARPPQRGGIQAGAGGHSTGARTQRRWGRAAPPQLGYAPVAPRLRPCLAHPHTQRLNLLPPTQPLAESHAFRSAAPNLLSGVLSRHTLRMPRSKGAHGPRPVAVTRTHDPHPTPPTLRRAAAVAHVGARGARPGAGGAAGGPRGERACNGVQLVRLAKHEAEGCVVL